MMIDCDRCAVRGLACGDCVVSVLLGGPPEDVALAANASEPGSSDRHAAYTAPADWGPTGPVHIDAVEVAALGALAAGGLVPPLRLVLPDTGTG